ncbi:hypothetical protein [Aeromicrobium sp. 179-A 4D2 NHS]|uniref:hypothetical protein n=1 Tax=Aeromicrobium sp. 179-A 4D2 NHS TaxID=3142375 RepID=UPI00399F12EE
MDAVNELVQPIFVQRGADHEETVYAAMCASFRLVKGNRDHPAVVEWMSGRFTKTVRRLKHRDMDVLAKRAKTVNRPDGDSPSFTVIDFRYEDARAVAMLPTTYDEFDPIMKRGQVSGTDFERTGTIDGDRYKWVTVFVLDSLTTGKAAAQAAHAIVALVDRLPRHSLPNLHFVDAQTLAEKAGLDGAVAINDAGLTEVEPGTLCAVGVPLEKAFPPLD